MSPVRKLANRLRRYNPSLKRPVNGLSNGMRLGDINLYPVSDGLFKLDGGAMFGIVPKPLWEKRIPSDRQNRITLSLTSFLVQTKDKNILINTGIGNKSNPKFRRIYGIKYPSGLINKLAKHGLKRENIDIVILTHLHFDHCGGNTIYNSNKKLVPTFPKARYVIQQGEWEDAIRSTERTSASYLKENLLPIQEAGNLELIRGNQEVTPEITVEVTGGHTKHHQVVIIHSLNQKAIYWSDLIPTTAHIDLPYIMAYDLYPQDTLEKKKELLEKALAEKWLCLWEHDPKTVCGYLTRQGRKIVAHPLKC